MTSVVFPGQGSQYFGMTKDFYDNFIVSKRTLEEVEEYTKLNLKKIIFEEDNELIDKTKYTQICIFASSLMIFKTLENENIIDNSLIEVMLGHSLGEYTALACSNKIDLKDCCLILKRRGELMNDAVPEKTTAMAALIGLDSDKISLIIKENNLDLEIANDNSPIQVVVSGDIGEINQSEEIFLKNDVKKYVILKVSAAFHSKYMLNAQKELSRQIADLKFMKNGINIISNYTAEISNDNIVIKKSLQNQMANRVRWKESIIKLKQVAKNNKIIEIGPNKILSGLIKRISNEFDIKNYSKITDLHNE